MDINQKGQHDLANEFFKVIRIIYGNGNINVDYYWKEINEGLNCKDFERRTIDMEYTIDEFGNTLSQAVSYEDYFKEEFQHLCNRMLQVVDSIDFQYTRDVLTLHDYLERIRYYVNCFSEAISKDESNPINIELSKERNAILNYLKIKLESVLKYINARMEAFEKEYSLFKQDPQHSVDDKTEKLMLDLTVEEIACLFRLLMEQKILLETNKQKVGRLVTKSFSSKKKKDFSENTFMNSFIDCIQKDKNDKINYANVDLLKSIDIKLVNLRSFINKSK